MNLSDTIMHPHRFLKIQFLSTCDIKIDLDLLVSGGAFDFSVPLSSPLGAMPSWYAASLLLIGKLPGARGIS